MRLDYKLALIKSYVRGVTTCFPENLCLEDGARRFFSSVLPRCQYVVGHHPSVSTVLLYEALLQTVTMSFLSVTFTRLLGIIQFLDQSGVSLGRRLCATGLCMLYIVHSNPKHSF